MRRESACIFGLLCVLTLLAGGSAKAGNEDGELLCLAQDGKTDCVIVVGTPATPPETFAVAELQCYLEKATGARLAVVKESDLPSTAHGIYVGWTEFAMKRGIDSAKLDEQEWVIQSVGQDLVLTGGRPVGTLYAVYEFLETKVGCRWLDRDTEIVPRAADLTITHLDVRGKPAFWQRSIYTGFASAASDIREKEGLFLVRNKSTQWPAKFGCVGYGSPGGCHTFYAYSKDFPADHPEYFSINAAGKRERATSGSGPGQLCLTNPEVRRLLLDRLKTFIAQDRAAAAKEGQPAPRVYDISQNDNEGMCLCPTCKAFADKEQSACGPLLDCINELADGIKDAYPDVLVMTFAYQNTLTPPKTVRPHDNVAIRLAQLNGEWAPDLEKSPHYPDYFRPMSHPINRVALADMTAWSDLTKHLAIWDYWIVYNSAYKRDTYPTPYVNVACIQLDLQLFLRSHVESVFTECEYSQSSFQELKLWLGQKLLQDPHQSAAPLLKSFMEGYYGSASPQMTKYLSYLEKQIAAVPATVKLSSLEACLRPYLTLEFLTTVHGFLTEAEKTCGPDANALLHVRQEWIPVDAAILNMWLQLEQQLPKGQKMPFDRSAILQQYTDIRLAMLERFYYGNIPAEIKKDLERELEQYRGLP